MSPAPLTNEETQKFLDMIQFALSQPEPIHAVSIIDFCRLFDAYRALESSLEKAESLIVNMRQMPRESRNL